MAEVDIAQSIRDSLSRVAQETQMALAYNAAKREALTAEGRAAETKLAALAIQDTDAGARFAERHAALRGRLYEILDHTHDAVALWRLAAMVYTPDYRAHASDEWHETVQREAETLLGNVRDGTRFIFFGPGGRPAGYVAAARPGLSEHADRIEVVYQTANPDRPEAIEVPVASLARPVTDRQGNVAGFAARHGICITPHAMREGLQRYIDSGRNERGMLVEPRIAAITALCSIDMSHSEIGLDDATWSRVVSQMYELAADPNNFSHEAWQAARLLCEREPQFAQRLEQSIVMALRVSPDYYQFGLRQKAEALLGIAGTKQPSRTEVDAKVQELLVRAPGAQPQAAPAWAG